MVLASTLGTTINHFFLFALNPACSNKCVHQTSRKRVRQLKVRRRQVGFQKGDGKPSHSKFTLISWLAKACRKLTGASAKMRIVYFEHIQDTSKVLKNKQFVLA